MDNSYFEYLYDQYILGLYTPTDDIYDKNIFVENSIPHKYSVIEERIDMTNIECYSVDPDGCEDADDAFSIYIENGKIMLAIHIADPTEYINIESTQWKTIQNRIVTRYPSNRKPFHMMSYDIMEKSSLMANKYGDVKNAVTILTEIDDNTYMPKGNIKLLYTIIKVSKKNALSYDDACNKTEEIVDLQMGLKISKALLDSRAERTTGTILNDVRTSIISYRGEYSVLENVSYTEKNMKEMIAEFAIFANSFIGKYLKLNFDEFGIFRTCSANDLLNNVSDTISGNELLEKIITNGIRAEYINHAQRHDLVGSDEYTHFTSPIRRASDCICHYLLKYIFLKVTNHALDKPFSIKELEDLSNKCIGVSKKMKKIQYKDTKFRLLQVMSNMLYNKTHIDIIYYITSCKNGFLNLIICNIENYNVYMSYTVCVNGEYIYNTKDKYTISITCVNYPKKFDTGSIPELDRIFT
jgi:exoribonuclease R